MLSGCNWIWQNHYCTPFVCNYYINMIWFINCDPYSFDAAPYTTGNNNAPVGVQLNDGFGSHWSSINGQSRARLGAFALGQGFSRTNSIVHPKNDAAFGAFATKKERVIRKYLPQSPTISHNGDAVKLWLSLLEFTTFLRHATPPSCLALCHCCYLCYYNSNNTCSMCCSHFHTSIRIVIEMYITL